jgi:hypothetical protein
MTGTESKAQVLLARVAVVVVAALFVLGLI